jgi:hypothetical protein
MGVLIGFQATPERGERGWRSFLRWPLCLACFICCAWDSKIRLGGRSRRRALLIGVVTLVGALTWPDHRPVVADPAAGCRRDHAYLALRSPKGAPGRCDGAARSIAAGSIVGSSADRPALRRSHRTRR